MTQESGNGHNRANVEKFFARYTSERADLFTEDALLVYPFCGDTTEIAGIRGRDRIRETFRQGMTVFHPFEYIDVLIFSTQDPDIFWVDAKSRGKQNRDGQTIDLYNKYIFYFRFEDGLIAELREYYNPILALKANHLPYQMPAWFNK